MPVEIRELVIRAVVGRGGDTNEERELAPSTGAQSPQDAAATEEIVQECVRQVLKILARNKER